MLVEELCLGVGDLKINVITFLALLPEVAVVKDWNWAERYYIRRPTF